MPQPRESGLRADTSYRRQKRTSASFIRGRYIPPENVPAQATCSTTYTLTTSQADVPGMSLTLAYPGIYLIAAAMDIQGATGDQFGVGVLVVGATSQTNQVVCDLDVAGGATRGTYSQVWIIVIDTPGTVIKMQAYKTSGSGNSKVNQQHSTLTAVLVV